MAACIRGLLRLNVGVTSNTLVRHNLMNVGVRFLYTEKSLGITGYESSRLFYRNQFMGVEDAFRKKMTEICDKEETMIFTEDLKSMVHLFQKTGTDIDLIVKMLQKYNNQNKELRFSSYFFGPVVMRALYFLDDPTTALNLMTDPQLQGFFKEIGSFLVLMCLLYKHQMYEKVQEVHLIMRKNANTINLASPSCSNVVVAACYKMNSTESLNYVLDFWKEMVSRQIYPSRRSIAMAAGLALNRDKPDIAIHILSGTTMANYMPIQNLYIAAYASLDRLADVVPIARKLLEHHRSADVPRPCFFSDVIGFIKEKLALVGNNDFHELQLMMDQAVEKDLIDTLTLDHWLSRPENIPLRVRNSEGNIENPRKRYMAQSRPVSLQEVY